MIFDAFTPILRLMMDDFLYLFRIHSAMLRTSLEFSSPKDGGFRQKTADLRLRYLRTMRFGVYLLIRKRAVLRYIYRLMAVYVCLLAPKGQANMGGF